MNYSKEWLLKSRKEDHNNAPSIEKQFKRLKEGEKIPFICDGFGITSISNIEDECHVNFGGADVPFRNIPGGSKIRKRSWAVAIIIVVGIVLIIGAWFITYIYLKDSDDRGTFGDMFGSINALYSGFALGGIILTIYLQKKELGYQRKELRQTRKEFEIQNETLRLQKFENTFFNLISNHKEMMDMLPPRKKGYGEKVVNTSRYGTLEIIEENFYRQLEYLTSIIKSRIIRGHSNGTEIVKKCNKLIEAYIPIAEDTELVLEFIGKSEIKNKRFYYDVLSTSMSFSESLLFGYYLEFFSEGIIDDKNVLNRFKKRYLEHSKIPLRREDKFPPIINYIRELKQRNSEPLNHLNMKVDRENLKDIVQSLKFGFKNNDDQIIEVKEVLVKIGDQDFETIEQLSKKINPGQKYLFNPFNFSVNRFDDLVNTEGSSLSLQYYVNINCEKTVNHTIKYDLSFTSVPGKPDKVNIGNIRVVRK